MIYYCPFMYSPNMFRSIENIDDENISGDNREYSPEEEGSAERIVQPQGTGGYPTAPLGGQIPQTGLGNLGQYYPGTTPMQPMTPKMTGQITPTGTAVQSGTPGIAGQVVQRSPQQILRVIETQHPEIAGTLISLGVPHTTIRQIILKIIELTLMHSR